MAANLIEVVNKCLSSRVEARAQGLLTGGLDKGLRANVSTQYTGEATHPSSIQCQYNAFRHQGSES